MNKKKVTVIALVAILIGGYAFATQQKSTVPAHESTTEVHIGALLAMSGYAAADGEDVRRGIELARRDLQDTGVTLNVEYYDDATDPAQTLSGLSFLQAKGVQYIIGPTWGFQVSAAVPAIENKDIAILLPLQASDNVLENSSKMFFAKPTTASKGPLTTKWLTERGSQKVALFVVTFSGDNWSEGHLDTWTKSVHESGASVEMVERISLAGESDTTKFLVLKAKQEGIDTILWTGTDEGAIALISEMQKLDYTANVLGTNQIEKVVSTQKISTGDLPLYTFVGGTNPQFTEKFESEYGNIRFDYAEQAYDLTMIAVESALRNQDHTDVAADIRKHTDYQGFAGTYVFDEIGDVRDATWELIKVN